MQIAGGEFCLWIQWLNGDPRASALDIGKSWVAFGNFKRVGFPEIAGERV